MIKKIIMLLVIVVVLYGASVFILPEVSSKVDTLIGIPGLSDSIRGSKLKIEENITDIPSLNEFKSGAIDVKEKFIDGVDITKDKIDTLREGVQKAEETFEDAKNTFNDAKNLLENANEKFEKIQTVIEDVKEIAGTGALQ